MNHRIWRHRGAVVVAVIAAFTPLPAAKAQDTALVATPPPRPMPGSVRGVVHDSIAGAPVAYASVQLVSAPGSQAALAHNARADDRGRYRIDNVEPGDYFVTFLHPLLDSLGIEPSARRTEVRERRETRADLATPSARRIMIVLCPANSVNDSTALLLGQVRDASTIAPRPGGTVSLTWSEPSIGNAGAESPRSTVRAVANATGWFAVCNLPKGISLLGRAAHGADSSGAITLALSRGAMSRKDMYVGEVIPIADGDIMGGRAADAAAIAGESLRTGPGRLRGIVRQSSGKPVAGARVRVWGSDPSAVTGADGGFELTRLPAGTQTLDVRAIGHAPARLPVDVLTDSRVNEIAVTLLASSRLVDTTRATASTTFPGDDTGFEKRRKSAVGHFVTRDDLAKKPSLDLSDALGPPSGVVRMWSATGNAVRLRSSFGTACDPVMFLDRARRNFFDIDASLLPGEIDGIEVYARPNQVPPEFMTTKDCGVVVVWTDRVPVGTKAP